VTECAEHQSGERSGWPLTTRGHWPFSFVLFSFWEILQEWSIPPLSIFLCHCGDSYLLPQKAGVRLAGYVMHAS